MQTWASTITMPVLGSTDDLAELLVSHDIDHVVLAFTADHQAGLDVVRVCNEMGVQVRATSGPAIEHQDALAHLPRAPADLRGPLEGECDETVSTPSFPYGSAVCEVEVDPETGVAARALGHQLDLELGLGAAEERVGEVRNAGAVFVGPSSPW